MMLAHTRLLVPNTLPNSREAVISIARLVMPDTNTVKKRYRFVFALLKFIFGRVNTREWLAKPELYGFHWFHGSGFGGGFPSGHMAVFTALVAAMWRYYPRYRPLYLILSLLLAAALIATNYHFLGDVIGGAYLGILVEAGTNRALSRTTSKF